MPNTIEQATRSGIGLSGSAPSVVTSYTHSMTVPGTSFSVDTRVIDGTNGADAISASSTTNYIFGFGGNDTLSAVTASGGASPALLVGGNGADTFVYGSSLAGVGLSGTVMDFSTSDGDKLDLTNAGVSFAELTFTKNAENGSSWSVTGGGLNIQLVGNPGDITLSSSNVLTDESGPDTTVGTDSDDTFTGTTADEEYSAGLGNDSISAGAGNDTVNGNIGDDTVFSVAPAMTPCAVARATTRLMAATVTTGATATWATTRLTAATATTPSAAAQATTRSTAMPARTSCTATRAMT